MEPRTDDGKEIVGEPAAAKRPRGSRSAAPRKPAAPEEVETVLAPALSQVMGYLLRRSHNAFQAYWQAHFRDSDTPITPVQAGMLVVVASNPGLTQTALARMMNVEGPTLMQSIDRLENHGYLQRQRRPGDRRSYILEITPRGREVLAAIDAFLPLRDKDLLADLTKADRTLLIDLLTRIVERGHQRLRELQAAADAGPAQTPATRPEARRL